MPALSAARLLVLLLVLLLVVATLPLLTPPASAADEPGGSGPTAITSGQPLTWGLKQTWRAYAPSPAVAGGAGVVDVPGGYNVSWAFDTGSFDAATGTTVLRYSGTAHWTKYRAVSEMGYLVPPAYIGDDPDPFLLDVTFTDPEITIGADASVLTVEVTSRDSDWNLNHVGRVAVADLDVSGLEPVVAGDPPVTTWSDLRTEARTELAGAGLYPAGTVMDRASFSYTGPGGAPALDETFDAEGIDVLEATVAQQFYDRGQFGEPDFWWVDQDDLLAHYSYRSDDDYVYQAFDLATMSNVGEPLALTPAEHIFGMMLWDTKRDRVIYRRPGETTGSRWITYDRDAGRYVLGTLASGALTTPSGYDPVRDRAYQIEQVRPEGVASNDYDHYRTSLRTWDFSDDGDTVAEGQAYVLPQFDPGFNDPTNTLAAAPGVGGNSGVAALLTSAVAADGSLVFTGRRLRYRDPGTGAASFPAMQAPGAYRVVLDDESGAGTRTAIEGTEFNPAGALDERNFTALATGPDGLIALAKTSRGIVQTFRVGAAGQVSDVHPALKLPYGAEAVSAGFFFSFDQADGTLWYGSRQSQRLMAVRDGRLVSSTYYSERSARGGVTVVGPEHEVYSVTTSGVAVGGASLWSMTRFDHVGTTPTVTTQPADTSVTLASADESRPASFTVAGSGRPGAAVQWQVKRVGAERFSALSGRTESTLTVDASRDLEGARYRALLSNAAGRVATEPATLTVLSAPRVETAPDDAVVTEGEAATFEVLGSGNPEPVVTWQRRVSGFWQSIAADDDNVVVDGGSLTLPDAHVDQSGTQVRAKLVNTVGTTFSPAATLTVDPVVTIPDGGLLLDGVTLEWSGSEELQAAPPFGGSNYLSAGVSDGTQATYQATAGDVSILHRSAGGAETAATYATRAAPTNGSVDQLVRFADGFADVEADGSASVRWDGTWSVNFYGGSVPFWFSDPVLTVDADGAGVLSADLDGYGSSQANPNDRFPLDEVDDVPVATFSGVEIDPDGEVTVTPSYAGVEVDVPAEFSAQNRTNPGWGSWPQPFVDFHFATGLSSYWYSSGGAADARKPAAPFLVDFTEAEQVDEEPEPELAAPRISTHPTAASVAVGADVTLGVAAEGEELSYQWQKQVGSLWFAIDGATRETFTLGGADMADAGSYRVKVSNSAGSVSSQPAEVRVAKHATRLAVSAPASITYGQSATVTVTAPGRAGTVSLTGAGAPRTATLAAGRATFAIPGGELAAGSHTLTASWTGDARNADGAATATVAVARATTRVTSFKVTRRPTSQRAGSAKLTLATTTGVPVPGTVVVTLTKGGATKRVTVALKGGAATFALPKLRKGRWTVRATYAATANLTGAAKTMKVRVAR